MKHGVLTHMFSIYVSFAVSRHDVAEVAGLTSFSFGEDEECRYVMLFKKVWMFVFPIIFIKEV